VAINYNSPSLDFDLEAEALVNALKNSRGMALTEAPAVAARGFTPSASKLGGVAAALTRTAGMLGENRVMDERRALADEELRRFTALQRELATPGTKAGKPVLTYANTDVANQYGTNRGSAQTQMLADQEAGMPELRADQVFNTDKGSQQSVMLDDQYDAFAPKPVKVNDPTDFVSHQTTVPLSPMEENARRMEIAQKMSRLPMARKQADQLWQKGIGFPEAMAQIEAKAAEAAAARAERTQLTRDQMRATEEWRAAQLRNDALARGDKLDARTQAASDKASAKAAEDAGKLDFFESQMRAINELVGERDAEGNLLPGSKVHPGFGQAVGVGFPGLRFVPGTETSSFMARKNQIVDSARLLGVQMMKGSGAVSNAEGAAAASAINRMNEATNEREFIAAAQDYYARMERAADRVRRGVRVDPVSGQEYTPAPAGATPGAPPTAPAAPPAAPAAPARALPRATAPAAGVQQTAVVNGKPYVKGADGNWYADTGAR
jgi:hypothetical protein